MNKPIESIFAHITCEVRTDSLTRALYATDASIYQIEPKAVAFPKTVEETQAVIRAAADAQLPITPRGAGTGLAGAAIGDGIILDMARHAHAIDQLDLEAMTVRVQPGVVLDQLTEFLKPHGVCFGPDVATSSRATLGGMIANNSSGARAPIYGTTADHLVSLDVVLADGTTATVGSGLSGLAEIHAPVHNLLTENESTIRERFPAIRVKRWPGYGLDRYLNTQGDLTRLISGSEGTLAVVTSATLRLSPIPKEKGLGVIFFASVDEAMQATVALTDLKPAAIEHVDRFLFEQTRGQLPFKYARSLLELDDKPCEAFLIVEFYDSVQDKLAALAQKNLGLRHTLYTSAAEMNAVWGLRKAGLSLLTGRKGAAKPISGLEDIEILPSQLPDFVSGLESMTRAIGLDVSYYGHAASGLLHIKPLVDLHKAEDIRKFREFAEKTSALTAQFHGSFSAEHGVGIARAEFMPEHIGPELLSIMRTIKSYFDPKGVMNPGKIFPEGGFKIDGALRQGAGYALELPFTPVLMYAAKDDNFVDHLEQCNGCGGCKKATPVMCPTFIATGEEIMSTRGRANAIRAALEHRLDEGDPLVLEELDQAISNCLSCKACGTECPSNVNMSLLKAELLHARHQKYGLKLYERLVSRFDLLGKAGCLFPPVANAILSLYPVRLLMEALTGFAAQRPLPRYTSQRFDAWFAKRPRPKTTAPRGDVLLWDDCSVRYHESAIGMAAVQVLEAAGYRVLLAQDHACCGRPAFSVGRLDKAREFGNRNVQILLHQYPDIPVVFLEPSCYSMFSEDYRELDIPQAEKVASRCFLFEQFIYQLLSNEPDALTFKQQPISVAIHAHCHAKALTNTQILPKLAGMLPNAQAKLLDSGCCGMAGSFGALKKKYALSIQTAEALVTLINALPDDTTLIASGTSCRQQITHLTRFQPSHMAELLAEALEKR